MKCVRIALIFGLVVVGCALVYLYLPPNSHKPSLTSAGVVKYVPEEHHWRTRLQSVDPETAYEELAQSVRGLSAINQHIAAHAFGNALWTTEGVRGADVCDERFLNGCMHSYVAATISDLGLIDGAVSINERCATMEAPGRSLPCRHGIGHGLISYLGYEHADLEKALSVCAELPHVEDLTLGCWGGAMMEYNIRDHVQSLRPLTEENRYDPCFSLREEEQAACMLIQPVWWYPAIQSNDSVMEPFATMGRYCASPRVPEKLSEACFMGIGLLAPSRVELDPDATIQACVAAADTATGRIACWSGASTLRHAYSPDQLATLVCNGLNETEHRYCEEHMDETTNFFKSRSATMFP